MSTFIHVVTTTEHQQDAQRIGRELVERRLAACAQVAGPISSTYRWRGNVETAEEWQCWAKCRLEAFDEVQRAVRALHSYEVPEILAMPILDGTADYLAWLDEALQK